jgi:glycosyltransferase involved in cell wall biosynthesis
MVHLLAGFNNNSDEWNDSLVFSVNRPRLPLPYAFGASFYKRGYNLSAIDFSSSSLNINNKPLFETIYPKQSLLKAVKETDISILWAMQGIKAITQQLLLKPTSRKIILASYVWDVKTLPNFRTKKLGIATHIAAHFAKALIVMTSEQEKMARQSLSSKIPVIKFTCGIDTQYYRSALSWLDVPHSYVPIVEELLTSPYIIMLGSQQRLDKEMLDIVSQSRFKLVRIASYDKNKSLDLHQQIQKRNISKQFIFIEKISYPFLRFLLRHANVCAGLVDSRWQPAGWTVACEALASGIPLVLYEGLVSRELQSLGVGSFMKTVAFGDTNAFKNALSYFIENPLTSIMRDQCQEFAKKQLDLNKTGDLLVNSVEKLVLS